MDFALYITHANMRTWVPLKKSGLDYKLQNEEGNIEPPLYYDLAFLQQCKIFLMLKNCITKIL